MFFKTYGLKDKTQRYVHTDQGGELARSEEFRRTIMTAGYILEPTGAGNSSQNGKGERPHRTLANMVLCLLYSSSLGAEFWSDAIQYAYYLY